MPANIKSYVKKGHAYFSNTGGYHEVTTSAKDAVKNDASSAKSQKKLANKGKDSAAAQSFNNVWKELGWD